MPYVNRGESRMISEWAGTGAGTGESSIKFDQITAHTLRVRTDRPEQTV